MNWRRVLFNNLGFKLAALVVVALLWISVTADERQAQPVATRVEYVVRDSAWILVGGPTEVSTTFQGRNRELLGLLMEEPVITVEIDSVAGSEVRVPLPLDRVRYNRELGVIPGFITPAAVDLQFERRVSARVAVAPNVAAMPAAGYTVLAPFVVEPETVTVAGPASWLADLTRIPTRLVELENLSNTVIRDIGLEVPAGVQGVTISPPSVLVTVNLDSLVIRQRRVPVRLTGAAARLVRSEPDSVDVVFRGAASNVSRAMANVSAVSLEIGAPPDSAARRDLEVKYEAAGAVAATAEPPSVTIRPLQ